jgi:probable poly-beta-1,6-N-acetyl-D-glucosamine export protein
METEGLNLLILSAVALFYTVAIFLFFDFSKKKKININLLKEKTKKRIDFFDFAKGVATTAVVIIHISFFIKISPESFSYNFLVLNNYADQLMRFAIPVFFISSGALLSLENLKKETLQKFYINKIKRVVFPYAVFSFSATYVFLESSFNLSEYFVLGLKDFFTGGALIPYWFVPVLLQFYILYPLFWYFFVVKKINPLLILGSSFIFSFTSYFLFSPKYFNLQNYLGDAVFFGGFIFFFVLGIFLRSFFLEEQKKEVLIKVKFFYFAFLVFVLYVLITITEPLTNYYNTRLIYGPVVMLSLFYFYFSWKNKRTKILFEKIGKNSLWIYLSHFIILYFIFGVIFLSFK